MGALQGALGINKCSCAGGDPEEAEGSVQTEKHHDAKGLGENLFFHWNGKSLASTDYKNNAIGVL